MQILCLSWHTWRRYTSQQMLYWYYGSSYIYIILYIYIIYTYVGGNIVKHECYSKEIDKEFVQQTSTMMLYPFKNKIGEIMGVIELGNSFIGAFGLDEEFMADSLCQFLSILAYKLASEKQFLSESWKIKDIQSACIKLYGEKDLFSITQIVQETINNIFGVKESVIVFLHPDQENIVIYDYLDRK